MGREFFVPARTLIAVKLLSTDVPLKQESGIKILLVTKWLICPTRLLPK